MSIKVRYNGLEIDGNLLPLFSGAFHYWSSPRGEWPAIFDQIKGLGFHVVETPVPWSLHELAEGDFDFGRVDPDKDLDAWLGLAHQKGFKVLLRLGPGAAGAPGRGWPQRILADGSMAALDGRGEAVLEDGFPVRSAADERLFGAFDGFLGALAPLVGKHLHPHGSVVALQVGHEAGAPAARGAYAMDYSPAALRLWSHFLDLKYRQLSALNKAWGTRWASFDEAAAPREAPAPGAGREALRCALDWAEYREYRIQWSLGRLSELYRERGLGVVPFYHNFPGPWTTPFNVPDIEADAGIDFCGFDSYPRADGALHAADQARYLSSSSRLAYVPEFGAGGGAEVHDLASTMLAPLMGGARGLNFHMAVDREGWGGAPLDVHGARREEVAQLFDRFNAFLRASEWLKATPQNQGLLFHAREAQQLEAALEGQAAGPTRAFYGAARAFCASRHYSFSLADGAVGQDRLARHAFVLATVADFLDEGAARRLARYAEEGGLLVLGPERPVFNARFEALKAFEGAQLQEGQPLAFGDGRILWLKDFDAAAVAAFLRKAKVFAETELSDPSLELASHKSGGRLLLFVRNPHAAERQARVLREGKFVLKPLWASGKFLGAVEEREVVLAPHEIKVWEVIPA
ncbi:MAG TPA: beta-galactosidase [bacterium]|jgi:beta-galactosidase|nr:beta-galactosidase [bacterium]